jgi:hypothetical protein
MNEKDNFEPIIDWYDLLDEEGPFG